MRTLVIAFAAALAGCVHPAVTPAPEAKAPLVPAARPRELAPRALYGARVAPSGSTFTCGEFFALLKATRPKTLEEALGKVREVRPGYLEHATFAHATHFDDAGPAYPRAIVYGGDAKMIMSFNGHPRQKGFERLQVMCFDDGEQKFSLSEVAFPAEAKAPAALTDLSAAEAAEPFVALEGRTGARDCRQCHEAAAKPVWDAAALWPGLYGAIGDGLFDDQAPDARPIYSTLERLNWAAFRTGAARKGRYAFVTTGSPRPNADLTHALSYLNGQRIVGDLRRLGDAFKPARLAFASALICAPRGERLDLRQFTREGEDHATISVLPESADGETRELFLSAYYDQMGKEKRNLALLKRYGLIQPLPKEHFEELRAYYRKLFREENLDQRLSDVDVDQVLALRELKRVVEPFGIDIQNWSMVFHGGYAFENGATQPGRTALRATLERPFAEAFLREDKQLFAAITARERAEEEGTADPAASEQTVCGLLASPAGQPRAPAGN